jgi:glycosyltransferase involved in cell wall biosynthesis
MLMAHASTIVAVGPSFEAEINRLYPCTTGRSTHVIAGAPRRLPQPQWPSPKAADILRIIMVGRPSGQKGWEYVAEALGQLDPKLGHRIELVIIGGLGQGQGPYSSYSTHMAERFAALAHTPVFNLGELPHDTVLAHLKAADLLLFPSIFEPLGLVLLEAMAAGTCIVASDAAGPVDLVREPWGRLMPFSDPKRRVEEITRGIKHAVNLSKAEREAYKSSARTAARMHTWSACAEVHIEALLAL